MKIFTKDLSLIFEELKSSKNGLTSPESVKKLHKNGKNELIEEKSKSIIRVFLSQFKDFMIGILLISALISLLVSFFEGNHEYYDFVIILSIVLCNGIIGTVQEFKADKAIKALKSMSSPCTTVLRDGKKKLIDSRNIVIGDVVLLKSGDIAPADIRLISCVSLSMEESSLTGESIPVEKNANANLDENCPISEQANMIFSGTGVSSGYCKGIVVATSMDTQIGKIASLLQKEKSPQTPLQQKLNQTGKMLGIAVLAICGIIFLLGLFKQINILEMLLISISLAVAAIPEGLTAVVTIVLAMGVKKMASKKAIVRKLSAVETLGSVTVICSDKTGTLTENRMTVVEVSSLNGTLTESSEDRKNILNYATLCNNSEMIDNKFYGLPTETAIAKTTKLERDTLLKSFPRIGEIAFTSKRKLMTTVHKLNEKYLVITKGAPDYVLNLCDTFMSGTSSNIISPVVRAKIIDENTKMAKKGLRILAVSIKYINNIESDENLEKHLCFCGLIGIEDPPRKEAKLAVEKCLKAGIKPVMITGDQTETALAIAKRIGIYKDGSHYMTGTELSTISENDLCKNIYKYSVFSRVSPEDKVKIVKAFQQNGELIAMTGDGINDAPALKTANIGSAMGKNGTEVAKSAADMVLMDDNFATIIEAIKQGRGIFKNIQKTVHFLLSCNMGEIILIFVAFLMGLPVPLLATQILWVNLVTDSFPALALGISKSDDDIMNGSFNCAKNGIINRTMCFEMIVEGALIGIISLIAFIIGRNFFDIHPNNPIIGRTMSFAVLCLSQLVHSINLSSSHSIFSPKHKSNPKLILSFILCTVLLLIVIIVPHFSLAFKTVALTINQWIYVIVLSICPLLVVELEKNFTKKS